VTGAARPGRPGSRRGPDVEAGQHHRVAVRARVRALERGRDGAARRRGLPFSLPTFDRGLFKIFELRKEKCEYQTCRSMIPLQLQKRLAYEILVGLVRN
jgi:hypothetical protein